MDKKTSCFVQVIKFAILNTNKSDTGRLNMTEKSVDMAASHDKPKKSDIMGSSLSIMILGVGNILFSDDGVGIRVIEKLEKEHVFPDNVSVVDGGVLGINLFGVIANADYLIIVDTVLNNGKPGDIYRLTGKDIPARIRAKNSLHEVDLVESITLFQLMDHSPETVIIGIEPKDIETMNPELTDLIRDRVDDLVNAVLDELRITDEISWT